MCDTNEWIKVSNNKTRKSNFHHSKSCECKIVVRCYLGKCILTKRLLNTDIDEYNSMTPVSIHNNVILDDIVKSIGCICHKSTILKEFTIIPDSKYRIKVKKILKKTVELEQWCCHYDTVMELTPISVRKVLIIFQ
jgi:hypothetical protein